MRRSSWTVCGVELVIVIAACSVQEVSTPGGVKSGSKEFPNRLIEARDDLLKSLPEHTGSRDIVRECMPK